MDIIKKFNLDTKDESLFYKNFFQYVFDSQPMGTKAIDFLHAIEKAEETVQHYIAFFPSIEFNFIKDYLLMDHLSISVYIDFFNTCSFETNPRVILKDFIQKNKHVPMDMVFHNETLTLEEKVSKLKKLFEYLATERGMFMARNLTLEDYSRIRERQKTSKVPFEKLVNEYDFKKRLLYIKDLSSKPEIIPDRVKKTFSTTRKSLVNSFVDFSFFISKLRPWSDYDILIRVQDNHSHSYYGKEMKKGWFQPSNVFYEHYGKPGARQENTIFYNGENVGFQIAYGKAGKWYLQDQSMFAQEMAWKKDPKMTSFEPLKRVLVQDLFNHEKLELSLQKTLLPCLADILDPQVNLGKVYSLLSLSSSLSVYEYFKRFYHLYGRINKREPLEHLHHSLPYKLNECFFNFETILEAPLGLVFPEFHSYSEQEQNKINNVWESAFHQFIGTFLYRTFREYNINLPMITRKVLEKFEIHRDYLDTIYNDVEFLDLLDVDLEENSNPFLNSDLVPSGKKAIGRLCDPPSYWNNVEKIEKLESGENEMNPHFIVTELDHNDLENFVRQLENTDEVLVKGEEELESVEETEEPRDDEDELEFALEDTEIDLEQFYGE